VSSFEAFGGPLTGHSEDPTLIVKGQVVALFAFDVGFAVSFEKLDGLMASMPLPPLSQKKRTPAYLQYSQPPRVIDLGEAESLLSVLGRIQVMVFDFGAISVSYRWQLGAPADQLTLNEFPQLGRDLHQRNLESHARKQVQRLMQSIRPAIERPELSSLVEDYYLLIVEELNLALGGEDLLAQHGRTLAQILRFETEPLAPQQQRDALAHSLAYYQKDLTLVDWNAALIYDRDYWDAANVLELVNVELLEARYIDAELDSRIGKYQGLTRNRPEWFLPFYNPYRKTIQELGELRIESLVLAKRVENALKLVGDVYPVRIHRAAATRFYLSDWETAISRKLDLIADFYELVNDRVQTAQGQFLELVVIILILIEVLIAVLK